MKNVKPILVLFLTVVLLQMFGCIGKKDESFIQGKGSLELLSGANQTGIIGSFLTQTIKVKILKDAQVYSFAYAIFSLINCSGTKLVKVPIDKNGIAEFTWRLNDKIGKQQLSIYAYIDNIPFETLSITADALDYDKNNFNIASCLDIITYYDYNMVTADRKNVWAFLDQTSPLVPWYSNNGGRSWQIKEGITTKLQLFQALKNGDIYWVNSDTLFFSNDFGKTRAVKKVPELQQFGYDIALQATNTGKILLSAKE